MHVYWMFRERERVWSDASWNELAWREKGHASNNNNQERLGEGKQTESMNDPDVVIRNTMGLPNNSSTTSIEKVSLLTTTTSKRDREQQGTREEEAPLPPFSSSQSQPQSQPPPESAPPVPLIVNETTGTTTTTVMKKDKHNNNAARRYAGILELAEESVTTNTTNSSLTATRKVNNVIKKKKQHKTVVSVVPTIVETSEAVVATSASSIPVTANSFAMSSVSDNVASTSATTETAPTSKSGVLKNLRQWKSVKSVFKQRKADRVAAARQSMTSPVSITNNSISPSHAASSLTGTAVTSTAAASTSIMHSAAPSILRKRHYKQQQQQQTVTAAVAATVIGVETSSHTHKHHHHHDSAAFIKRLSTTFRNKSRNATVTTAAAATTTPVITATATVSPESSAIAPASSSSPPPAPITTLTAASSLRSITSPSPLPIHLETDEMETEITLTYQVPRTLNSQTIVDLDDSTTDGNSDCIDNAFQQQPDDNIENPHTPIRRKRLVTAALVSSPASTSSSLSLSSSSASSFSSLVGIKGAFPSLLSPQRKQQSGQAVSPCPTDEDDKDEEEEEGCEIIFFSESNLDNLENNNNTAAANKKRNTTVNPWNAATNDEVEVDFTSSVPNNFDDNFADTAAAQDDDDNDDNNVFMSIYFPWQQKQETTSPMTMLRRTEQVERGIFLSFQDMGFKTTASEQQPNSKGGGGNDQPHLLNATATTMASTTTATTTTMDNKSSGLIIQPQASSHETTRPPTVRSSSSPTIEGFFNRTSPVVVNDSRQQYRHNNINSSSCNMASPLSRLYHGEQSSPTLQSPSTLKRIRTPIHAAAAAMMGLTPFALSSSSPSPPPATGAVTPAVMRSFATGNTGGVANNAGPGGAAFYNESQLYASFDTDKEKVDLRPVKEIVVTITPESSPPSQYSASEPTTVLDRTGGAGGNGNMMIMTDNHLSASRAIRVNHIRNAIFDSLTGTATNNNNNINTVTTTAKNNSSPSAAVWNQSSMRQDKQQLQQQQQQQQQQSNDYFHPSQHHLTPLGLSGTTAFTSNARPGGAAATGMDISALTLDSASRFQQVQNINNNQHHRLGLNIFGPNPPSAAAIALGTPHHHHHHDHRRQPSTGDAQPITTNATSSSSFSLGGDQSLTPSYRPSETNPVFGEEKKDDGDFLKGLNKILDLGYSHAVQKHKDWNLVATTAAARTTTGLPPEVYTKNSDDPFDGLESTAASSNYTGLTTNTTSTAGDEESIGLNALSPREQLYAQVRANSVATAEFGVGGGSGGSEFLLTPHRRSFPSMMTGGSDEMLGPFRRVLSAGDGDTGFATLTGGGSAFDQYPISNGVDGDELSIEHRAPDEQIHDSGCASAFVSPVSSSDMGRRSGFFDDYDDENNIDAALQRPSMDDNCWTAPVTMVSAVAQQHQEQQGGPCHRPCHHPYPLIDADSYSDGGREGDKVKHVLFTTTGRNASPPSPISFDGYSGSIMKQSPSLESDSLVGSAVGNSFYRTTSACHCFDAMPMLEQGRWKSRRMKAVTADDDQSNSLLQGDMTRSDNCVTNTDITTTCPTSAADDDSESSRDRNNRPKQQQQQGFNSFVNTFSEMARSTTDNIQNFWRRRRAV